MACGSAYNLLLGLADLYVVSYFLKAQAILYMSYGNIRIFFRTQNIFLFTTYTLIILNKIPASESTSGDCANWHGTCSVLVSPDTTCCRTTAGTRAVGVHLQIQPTNVRTKASKIAAICYNYQNYKNLLLLTTKNYSNLLLLLISKNHDVMQKSKQIIRSTGNMLCYKPSQVDDSLLATSTRLNALCARTLQTK